MELEQTDAAHATLRVRDQGVGISAVEQKRIFKRFYRIPGAVTDACQGHRPRPVHRPIGRRAARRQGVRRERRARAAAARSPCSCRSPAAAMSRILIVEDEQHLADGLRFNLEAEQHDVDVVDTGEDGARAARPRSRAATTSSFSTSCCRASTASPSWPSCGGSDSSCRS